MSLTCVNCGNDPVYYVNDPGADPLLFCSVHLPRSYSSRANAGQFAMPEEVDGQLELPFDDE